MHTVTPRPRDDSAGVLSEPNSEDPKLWQDMGLEGIDMASASAQTHPLEPSAQAATPCAPVSITDQLLTGTPYAQQAGISPQATTGQHPAFAVHASLLQHAGLSPVHPAQSTLPAAIATSTVPVAPSTSPTSMAAAHLGAQSHFSLSGDTTASAPPKLYNSGGSGVSVSDGGHSASPTFIGAAPVAASVGFATAPPSISTQIQHPGLDAFQHQQLAGAAESAQRTVAQRTAEQQIAALEFQNAAAAAGKSTDPVQRAQATAAAHHAKTAYDVAGMEAAAAQNLATQLQAASLGLSAAPVADMLPVTAPQAPSMQAMAVSQQTAAATAAAAPLMQAAMSAKQTATQKTIETHAAAAAYQAASLQAGSTSDPLQHAMASMAAQQAAMTYHTAAHEASNAASTAAQLEQAAAAAAVAATMATPMQLPASAPLAAHIATGAMLPQYNQQVPTFPQQTTLSMLTPPTLLSSMEFSSGGHYSAYSPLSGISQQPALVPSMHAVHGALSPLSTLGVPAVSSVLPTSPSSLMAPSVNAAVPPAVPPPVLPGMGLSVPQPPTASILEGVSTAQSTLTTLPSGMGLSPLSSIAEVPPSSEALAFNPPSSPAPLEIVKAVCTSGGSFIRGTSGTWDYDGGETRLVSLCFGCSAEALFSTLERATSSLSDSSEQATDFAPIIKYRLPSDPSVWVDLVDDDDVFMMFDEWEELLSATRTSTGPGSDSGSVASGNTASTRTPQQVKLHIYVQWRPVVSSGLASSGVGAEGGVEGGGVPPPADSAKPGHNEANNTITNGVQVLGGEGNKDKTTAAPAPTSDDQASTSRAGHAERAASAQKSAKAHRRTQMERLSSSIDLTGLVERMEIINASDISLVRFLGSGSFGDVYLSKWRGCEVAVKCLNPALFFQGSEPGSINRAAVVDLIREADMLGSLRHPAVVWVYGLVLPDLKGAASKGKNGGGDGSDSDGVGGGGHGALSGHDLVDAIQSEADTPSMMPGILRPPALVTEYMAGGSLKSALTRRADIVAGALTRVVLALDAAKGMEYLHSKQIVHFDLKSGNLLLGYRDRRPVCKVADFGLAREKTQTFCSGVTSQRGTLPWTAPEILRTPNNVTEKVDVFSFAIVMWELWTGREPYEGLNYHALMIQLANPEARLRPPIPGTPEWESESDPPPELAPGWRALMERCWEENPEDRPSFTDIIKDLRGMVAAIKPARGAAQRNSSGSSLVKK